MHQRLSLSSDELKPAPSIAVPYLVKSDALATQPIPNQSFSKLNSTDLEKHGPPLRKSLQFNSAQDLLKYVTLHWQADFVTVDLHSRQLVEVFIRRPFFVLLSIDAPLYVRYLRSRR